MTTKRRSMHYQSNEVLENGEFLAVMDVNEHQWLLEHSHDFPEMICILNGKGTQFINGSSIPVKEGETYLIPVGTTHVFRPAAGNAFSTALRVRDIIFRVEWLEGLPGLDIETEMKDWIGWLLGRTKSLEAESPAWIKIDDDEGLLRRQTESLKQLIERKTPFYRTRLTAGVLELLTLLFLYADKGNRRKLEASLRLDMNPLKVQILETIQETPLPDISLQGIARRIWLSERHFSRVFRQHFGMSFNKYMQELRMKESKRLLEQSALTVKEIMKQVGFADADHFYGLFKQKTGVAPGKYRTLFKESLKI